MVRYAQRPWYTPLGFMNSSPQSYPFILVIAGLVAAFPFRYRISEYFERQRDGVHVEMREKAVRYYKEIERMHRRQTHINHQSIMEDNSGHRLSASMQTEALRMGQQDQDFNYWYAHQRDAIRAEKLMAEVRELQAKVAQSS